MLIRLSMLALAASTLPILCQAQTTHNLAYTRHNTVSLTNADADRISADGTQLLQMKDSASDVSCNVTIRRRGSVSSFSNTDGIIDNATEFVSVENVPGDIKVVRAINWCGSTGGGIIGCARTPGSSLLMVRFTRNQEGILMTHEFGHNQGLPHRNGLGNLMHPSIGTSRLGVNAAECNAFKAPASLHAIHSGDEIQAQGTEDGGTLELVRTHYYHGFPVSIGLELPQDDASLLVQILRDQEQVEWWPNAMTALGLMGADNASVEIRELLLSLNREDLDDPFVFRAMTTAPIALGYYVNRTGDRETLDYLIEGADPSLVKEGSFSPLLLDDGGQGGIDALSLSGTFIAGLSLAVTEDDRALNALESIQKSQPSEFQAAVTDAVSQAIFEYGRVRELGLLEYSEE